MELIKDKRYWCVWAHRYGWYVGAVSKRNWKTGEREIVHQFRDVCDCLIECEEQHIEKWVKENP